MQIPLSRNNKGIHVMIIFANVQKIFSKISQMKIYKLFPSNAYHRRK